MVEVGNSLSHKLGGGGTAFPCVPLHFNHWCRPVPMRCLAVWMKLTVITTTQAQFTLHTCICVCVAARVALHALYSRSDRRRHFVLSLPRNGNTRVVVFPLPLLRVSACELVLNLITSHRYQSCTCGFFKNLSIARVGSRKNIWQAMQS